MTSNADKEREIMEAIQKVLSQHNVGEARVVVEMPIDTTSITEADTVRPQPGFRRVSAETLPAPAAAPGVMKVVVERTTTVTTKRGDGTEVIEETVTKEMKPVAASDGFLHNLENAKPAAEPLRSPPRQAPVARKQSFSERRTHTSSPCVEGEGNTGFAITTPKSAANTAELKPVPPRDSMPTPIKARAAAMGAESTVSQQVPLEETGGSLDATAKELDNTARPVSCVTPKHATTALAHHDDSATGIMDFDPSAMIPDDLMATLAMQEQRQERIRILNSFVGKSVLLADKKNRDLVETEPPAKQFLGSYVSGGYLVNGRPEPRTTSVRLPTGSAGSSATAKRNTGTAVAGKTPVISIMSNESSHCGTAPGNVTVSVVDTERRVSTVHEPALGEKAAAVSKQKPSILLSGSNGSHSGTLPTISGAAQQHSQQRTNSEGIIDQKTFTEISRDNSRRAAELSTRQFASLPPPEDELLLSGGGRVRSGAQQRTSGGTVLGSAGNASLRDMLNAQREGEKKFQRDLAQHARVMEAANRTSHLVAPGPGFNAEAVDAMQKASVSGSLSSPPPPALSLASGSAAVAIKGDAPLTASAAVSPVRTPTRPLSSGAHKGIQVVRFTMPAQEQAKSQVVAQLSRSPQGAQHVNSKDKYKAMLSSQKTDMERQKEMEKEYQQVLEKAIEYNKTLHVKPQ